MKISDRVQYLQTQFACTTRYTLKRPKINTLIRLSKTRSVSVTTWLTQWLTKVGLQCPATQQHPSWLPQIMCQPYFYPWCSCLVWWGTFWLFTPTSINEVFLKTTILYFLVLHLVLCDLMVLLFTSYDNNEAWCLKSFFTHSLAMCKTWQPTLTVIFQRGGVYIVVLMAIFRCRAVLHHSVF